MAKIAGIGVPGRKDDGGSKKTVHGRQKLLSLTCASTGSRRFGDLLVGMFQPAFDLPDRPGRFFFASFVRFRQQSALSPCPDSQGRFGAGNDARVRRRRATRAKRRPVPRSGNAGQCALPDLSRKQQCELTITYSLHVRYLRANIAALSITQQLPGSVIDGIQRFG